MGILGTFALFCYICTKFLNDNRPLDCILERLKEQTDTRISTNKTIEEYEV